MKELITNLRFGKKERMAVVILSIIYLSFLGKGWYVAGPYYSISETIYHSTAFLISIILFGFLSFINLYILAREEFGDFSWYTYSFGIFVSKKNWENSTWYMMLIPIQVLNFFLLVWFRDYYFVWFLLLPVILFFSFLSLRFKRYQEIIIMFLSNLLISFVVFCYFNFKINGVYFFWLITGSDCFINYGAEEIGDPLYNIEFFNSIAHWEKLRNPVPAAENNLEFFTIGFVDTLIFYFYPMVIILIVVNAHYMFGKNMSLILETEEDYQST